MCGIAGVIGLDPLVGHAIVADMTRAIGHRGPDDAGLEVLDGGTLVFGHRRLSILDLSPLGHQPMASADGRCWITYNGEIYNFREIRRDLEAAGHRFRGGSDTEVILAAYDQWGLASVERFRGMFAFALWDGRSRTLHLCRDRFGVKPLFLARSPRGLAFASEIRALHAVGLTGTGVDPVALADYVQYGYATAPQTLFEGVRAVRPGTVLSFDDQGKESERLYWSVDGLYDDPGRSALRAELQCLPDEALLDRLEASLSEAFRYRMVADVPVGVFLSGGIDSSLVAALLSRDRGERLRTFTIGYGDAEFDETSYARTVAGHLGTDHTEFTVSPAEMLGLFDETLEIGDEPIGDSSLVPTLMVSRLARRHVTVALSADGADELFGGYARYDVCGRHVARIGAPAGAATWLAAEALDRLPAAWIDAAYRGLKPHGERFAGVGDKLRKFVRMARAKDPFRAYEAAVSEWDAPALRRLGVRPELGAGDARAAFGPSAGTDAREHFMRFDTARYLPGDLLTKVDRASMAVSLESREPFLDHEMARLAVALPMDWKVRGSRNKYVLRRILDRHFPAGLFDRPKHGFSAPVGQWLRGPLREVLQDELSPERIRRFGLLDAPAVARELDGFLSDRGSASPAGMWFLLQLQRWAGRWLDAAPARIHP